jgi:lipopolysaccharide transport system ATP-binding protein
MTITFGGRAHELPPGAVIGCIGASDSGIDDVPVNYDLDSRDALNLLQAETEIEASRRNGAAVLVKSHDSARLRRVADEIWWIDGGEVRQKGDPKEVLTSYDSYVASRYRALRAGVHAPIAPSMRRGDGRAAIIELQTLDAQDRPITAWQSGETAAIRVMVRFAAAVEDPVVGIMIRTRIGMEVYGTNTELENLKLGPCAAGDIRTVTFTFECMLCPQAYTVTAASHDPDGVWHDWLEDAISFMVVDSRYTAGVANLRARVTCSRG